MRNDDDMMMMKANICDITCLSFGYRTFAATGPQIWNSLPLQSQTTWAVIRPVQAVTEDIFIQTVRPRRSVNCF